MPRRRGISPRPRRASGSDELHVIADDSGEAHGGRAGDVPRGRRSSIGFTHRSRSLRNHGRMDVYLGDFYAKDLDGGRLTEAEALRLLQCIWRLIVARGIRFDSRVIVGGKGPAQSGDGGSLRPPRDGGDAYGRGGDSATHAALLSGPESGADEESAGGDRRGADVPDAVQRRCEHPGGEARVRRAASRRPSNTCRMAAGNTRWITWRWGRPIAR